MAPDFDPSEAPCDHCGTPTERRYPPADIELCEDCYRLDQQQRELNEAIYTEGIRTWFRATEPVR